MRKKIQNTGLVKTASSIQHLYSSVLIRVYPWLITFYLKFELDSKNFDCIDSKML